MISLRNSKNARFLGVSMPRQRGLAQDTRLAGRKAEDSRTERIDTGIAAAASAEKETNTHTTDRTTTLGPSTSPNPARFAIIPAKAEAKAEAIIWFV